MTIRSSLSPDKKSKVGSKKSPSFFSKKNTSGPSVPQERFFSPNLAFGHPNDKYEKEADAMADRVVNHMHETPPSQVQAKCAECEKEENSVRQRIQEDQTVQPKDLKQEEEEVVQRKKGREEEDKDLQLKAVDDKEDEMLQKKEDIEDEERLQTHVEPGQVPSQSFDSELGNNKGNGTALPLTTRKQMEDSFGADFANVKVHTDTGAIQMAQELGAQAFTHGSDIYFNKGKYDTSSAPGKHLLAHELTHVVQQHSALKKKRIQRQLVFGSGYAGYPSVTAEVGKAKAGKWNPTTTDFSTNAGRSGGGEGAKDLPGLLKIIGSQTKGSIKQLGIIGHSNSRALGLSGDVHTAGVPLTGLITEATLKSNKDRIDAVRDRFADGSAITLFSCNSGGISNGLAEVISEAFGVCVKGFKNDVLWCITFNESPLTITSRGNVFYENPNDPLAGAGLHPSCANFHKKVLDLTPDVSSCKGVKTQPGKKCVSLENIPVLQSASLFRSMSFTEEAGFANSAFTEEAAVLEGLTVLDGMDKNEVSERTRVSKLQRRLNHHGASIAEDGMFGNNTLAVLNQFQSRLGLEHSSVVSRETAEALVLPSLFPGDVKVISEVEGLKTGDGLVFGTFHLRPRVSRLQQLLTIHGNFTKVDGMFGPRTKSAMNMFQALNNLSTSDLVDGDTADALEGRTADICPFGQVPLTIA